MNILYINHYAGSDKHGMEFRPFYLAKEWAKGGLNTTIVAADYSHLRKVNPEVSCDFQEENVDGITYCWVKTVVYEGNGLSRVLSMIQFVSKLIFGAKLLVNRYEPDVVICSSTYPLDTYAGQLIAKLSGAKLIHEVHDLWPLTPMELGGYSKYHPWIKVLARAEKSAYKKSACIISILPNVEEYVRELGIDTKVVHIPNGVVLRSVEDSHKNKEIEEKVLSLREEGFFVVGYAGGLSVSNAMMDFVRAADLLKQRRIAFLIIGDGIEKSALVQFKEDNCLENVHFYNPIPKNEIHSTLSLMDALYIGSKKSNLYQYGVSANKIFDYMLTGRPIIDAFDTYHSPLNYSSVSYKAEPENPTSIADCIEKVSRISREELEETCKKSVLYVTSYHGYEYLAKSFANEF